MVVEKVNLVHVKYVPVGSGQDPGLEALPSFGYGPLQVQCPGHAVLGRVQRKLHHLHRHGDAFGLGARVSLGAFCAVFPSVRQKASAAASFDDDAVRKKAGQGPDSGGLGGPFLSTYQDPSDAGADRVEDEGQLHLILADDG